MNPPFRFQPPLGPPKSTPRQRALAALRGLDLAPLEKVRERPAQPVRDVMDQVLKNARLDRRRAEAEIMRVWNHLMDPLVTAHAQPTGIHNGTLFVSVDSHVWRDEIVRYRRKEILDRLQHSFGRDMIKRISFRVG